MGKRAEQIGDTRLRIIEATMYLHGTVGPARTTISGVAERAGVTRLTVYRHFPDEGKLFAACSAHWLSQQERPDPSAWTAPGPAERLRTGLADAYRFYRAGESMLVRIYADKAALPAALRQALDDRDAHFRDALLEPFGAASGDETLRAVVGHAVSFWTWRSLCRDQGLSNESAVELMTTLALSTASHAP